MTPADLLNQIARNRGISFNQLAAYLGVNGSTMNRWTHSQSVPDPRYCWKIAEMAGWTIEEVMRLAGHLPPADSDALDPIDPLVREKLSQMSRDEQRRLDGAPGGARRRPVTVQLVAQGAEAGGGLREAAAVIAGDGDFHVRSVRPGVGGMVSISFRRCWSSCRAQAS